MTETPALRFNIYERIRLSDNAAAIKELDEMELAPHIQVLTREDQVILKGNLYFEAKYSAEQSDHPQVYEHFIPVEISLPTYRVDKLEDIAVTVENFDVEVVSQRILNITGTLLLTGVRTELAAGGGPEESSHAGQTLKADEGSENGFMVSEPGDLDGEKVFIHEFNPQTQTVKEVSFNENTDTPSEFQEPPEFSMEENEYRNNEDSPLNNEDSPLSESSDSQDSDVQEVHAEEAFAEGEASMTEPIRDEPLDDENKELATEPREMNITLKPKASAENEFLASSIREPEEDEHLQEMTEPFAGEEISDVHAPVDSKPNELKWKNLFLSSASNEDRFKKLKICIVQKEETLETIAQKYNINPREIILYNRLGDQEVTEGQVLYIPK